MSSSSDTASSAKTEPIMWGLFDYGERTYMILMYRDEPPLFRFGAYAFDSNGELYNVQIARWWYDAETQEYYDKASLVVEARRVVFAMMIDIIARDIIGLFAIRDRTVTRSQLKEMYYSDEGADEMYGDYALHEKLRKKHYRKSGLDPSYGPDPV